MLSPELAIELKNSGKDIIVLKHAYRVNGVVDIWFNGKTLFDKKANVYYTFNTSRELLTAAFKIINTTEKSAPFKKLSSGRMSYKEFRNTKKAPSHEYYAWENNTGSSEDYLYFIRAGIYIKIGRSKDPKKRLKTIQTGTPERPKIILKVKNKGHMERILHSAFKDERQNGEWFFYSDRIKKFVFYLKSKPKLPAQPPQIFSHSDCSGT